MHPPCRRQGGTLQQFLGHPAKAADQRARQQQPDAGMLFDQRNEVAGSKTSGLGRPEGDDVSRLFDCGVDGSEQVTRRQIVEAHHPAVGCHQRRAGRADNQQIGLVARNPLPDQRAVRRPGLGNGPRSDAVGSRCRTGKHLLQRGNELRFGQTILPQTGWRRSKP